jgi:hypothetical protein
MRLLREFEDLELNNEAKIPDEPLRHIPKWYIKGEPIFLYLFEFKCLLFFIEFMKPLFADQYGNSLINFKEMSSITNHVRSIVKLRVKSKSKCFAAPTWMGEDASAAVDSWIDDIVKKIQDNDFRVPLHETPQGMSKGFSAFPNKGYRIGFLPVDYTYVFFSFFL